MRIYENWEEAYDEIKRNVGELGTVVPLYSMQDKIVEGNDDYVTKELIGECYKLVGVRSSKLLEYMQKHGYSSTWAMLEFQDRVSGKDINPGEAWLLRENVWKEFIHDGKFSYTYAERFAKSISQIIKELKEHKTTRQAVMAMWDINKDPDRFAKQRVPCTIYYQFLIRKNSKGQEELHMIYTMRSSDVITHFVYDVCLALMMQEYIANKVGVLPGSFTHFIGSCHAYKKDLKGVF